MWVKFSLVSNFLQLGYKPQFQTFYHLLESYNTYFKTELPNHSQFSTRDEILPNEEQTN